jgi:hypothetical protein
VRNQLHQARGNIAVGWWSFRMFNLSRIFHIRALPGAFWKE